MIAFGTAISNQEIYERVALPSIQRVAEADSLILTRPGYDSIQAPYNELLDEAAELPDLDALILLHQDLELGDDSLLERVRALFEDPRTGLVGPLGARNPKVYWNEGELFGTAETPDSYVRHSIGPHDVEVVDGVLLAIPAWVVRSVRFDPRLAADFHGYDVDYSFRVRAAGGRVLCDDIPYVHHMRRPWSDQASFIRGTARVHKMWHPHVRPREWQGSFQR